MPSQKPALGRAWEGPDETYHGKTAKPRVPASRKGRPYPHARRGPRDKRPILALVERGGNVRTFHVPVADQATVEKIVTENIARESRLHTDESRLYFNAPDLFAAHETVHYTSGQYVRYEDGRVIHTNSAERYFSILSAACAASISTAARSICIVIPRNTASVTITGSGRIQRYRPHQGCDQGHRRQAADLSSSSLARFTAIRPRGFCAGARRGAGDDPGPSRRYPSSCQAN